MQVWHPILAAVETSPTVFELRDQYGKPYAIIRLVTVGAEVGWRAVLWAEVSADRELVGYFTALLPAAKAAHLRWLSTAGSHPSAEYPTWAEPPRT